MKKYALRLSFVSVLLFFVLLLAADSGNNQQPSKKVLAKRVATTVVESVEAERTPQFSGALRAVKRADLAFTLSGRLETRPIQIGDAVERGQILASLDKKPLRNAKASAAAKLADLEARVAQSERDLKRVRELVDARAATKEELERVLSAAESLKANRDAAASQLREASRMLAEADLKAPFNGVVTAIHMESGEFSNAGRPVASLGGLDALELEVEVQESLLPHLRQGAPASLHLPFSNNRKISGHIKSLGRATSGVGRLFPVVIEVEPQPNLMAGMTAVLSLNLPSENQLAIPIESVVNPGGSRPSVFRVRENSVERVEVRVGRLLGEKVTVSGELQPGERVVVSGFSGLSDGESVEVAQ